MLFDFETFSMLVKKVYKESPYTLEQVLWVFRYYFMCYEAAMGKPHPNIRLEQIRHIVEAMPYIDREAVGGCFVDIDLNEYQEIIDQHFRTSYRNCDYNINHFFSGQIRELRFYETCY